MAANFAKLPELARRKADRTTGHFWPGAGAFYGAGVASTALG